MLTKKIHRQPAHSVRTPPTSGPIATAAPVVAPQIPNAVPRSRPWNAFASSASDTANMTPPPTPCTARAAMSTPASFAIPQPNDATVNSTRPIVNTSRRPKRSASDPAASTVVASVSAYASTTHCNCAKLASRSRWMSGSATFTTVMSSNNMKIAVQTAINVHHLRSSPSTARGYFAGDPHRNGGIDAPRPSTSAASFASSTRRAGEGRWAATIRAPHQQRSGD